MNHIVIILIIVFAIFILINVYGYTNSNSISNILIENQGADKLIMIHLFSNENIMLREYIVRFVNQIGNQYDILKQLNVNNHAIIRILCKYQCAHKQTQIKELFEKRLELIDKMIIAMYTNHVDGYIDICDEITINNGLICTALNKSNCLERLTIRSEQIDAMTRELINHRPAINEFIKLNGMLDNMVNSLIS